MNTVKIITYALVLIAKFPGLLIRLVYNKRQGARTFRKELIHAGIAPEQAEELTRHYKAIVPEWKELLRYRVKRH